jgi:hypothetical protein
LVAGVVCLLAILVSLRRFEAEQGVPPPQGAPP